MLLFPRQMTVGSTDGSAALEEVGKRFGQVAGKFPGSFYVESRGMQLL